MAKPSPLPRVYFVYDVVDIGAFSDGLACTNVVFSECIRETVLHNCDSISLLLLLQINLAVKKQGL